ncbi:hypothetical protein BASA62_005222 [Batrachochytrium salamandrivorans]|nr:hypothetical protein BASA62_005222 [Batrachochytrium salamandrivorans]
MFPVSKAAVLKALCIPLCPLAPRRSVVALRSQSAYQSKNIRLQLEHNVMEEDQLAEIAGLTTKRQKLREQLILAQQQQPNP